MGKILDLIGIYIQDPSTMDVKVLNPQLEEFLVVILVLGITTFFEVYLHAVSTGVSCC